MLFNVYLAVSAPKMSTMSTIAAASAATISPSTTSPSTQSPSITSPSTPSPSTEKPLKEKASLTPTPPLESQTLEQKRDFNLLFHKADRITMNFTQNLKIAYSGCQHAIEDKFWESLKKNPSEYIIEGKVDYEKMRETYKSSARSLGIRIW